MSPLLASGTKATGLGSPHGHSRCRAQGPRLASARHGSHGQGKAQHVSHHCVKLPDFPEFPAAAPPDGAETSAGSCENEIRIHAPARPVSKDLKQGEGDARTTVLEAPQPGRDPCGSH